MSSKSRNVLKALAVILVILAVVMQLEIIIIPALIAYKFWLAIIGFALLLFASR
ncbi:hypothetical protein [Fulvivirga sedimenti]|jgi:hypothetical protein|uniref:Uncharacterized protein n=1 Tax=Fulvivirga sedimenti TaxID=2879465 RepID=A0A9X1KYN1_9BACT|nr:hypothetical protein [Fulvivirga sedimenti]MCA6075362.1 hypothetical protein [Fulvivirga sedimenti]MCA6076539.1 hypothetical protein [Fulvivirga sedimenti]MCA6077667.1 hypothetical protein [Fulvivirga sedimenti]